MSSAILSGRRRVCGKCSGGDDKRHAFCVIRSTHGNPYARCGDTNSQSFASIEAMLEETEQRVQSARSSGGTSARGAQAVHGLSSTLVNDIRLLRCAVFALRMRGSPSQTVDGQAMQQFKREFARLNARVAAIENADVSPLVKISGLVRDKATWQLACFMSMSVADGAYVPQIETRNMELRAVEIALEQAVAELGAHPQPNRAADGAGHLFDYCMDGTVSLAG